MVMILDAFLPKFADLLVQMVQSEVEMLLGIPGEIMKLSGTVHDIQCVLADAERKQSNSSAIKSWLMQLKDVMYDADDLIDLCQIKAKKRLAGSSSGPHSNACWRRAFLSCFRNPFFAHNVGVKIKEINSRLTEIAQKKATLGLIEVPVITGVLAPPVGRLDSDISRKTDPSVVMEDIVGEKIEEDAGLLVNWLTEENINGLDGKIGVVAIVGTGGIGKTTLAKRIFHDLSVNGEFDLKIWACITKKVKGIELLKSIIEQLESGKHRESRDAQGRPELVQTLEKHVQGKKFLLVLDDVWPTSVAVWEELLRSPMNGGARGSMVLVTAREEKVASIMRAIKLLHVDKLSEEDGWSLLIKQVFQNEHESEIKEVEHIGLQIVEHCDGLPVAIKTVGGLLRMKQKTVREWEAVLRSLDSWSVKGLPDRLDQVFHLSYEDLPSPLKQCLIFCSLYPQGSTFHQDDLIYLWFVEGFLQDAKNQNPWELGTEYYHELLLRNLLEDSGVLYDKLESKMPDIVWSFAHHLGLDENCTSIEREILSRQGYSAKLRRLYLDKSKKNEENEENLKSAMKEKGLRTLMIADFSESSLSDLCTAVTNLRILEFHCFSISSLPHSLFALRHLRYLDVRGSPIRTIPESIGYLINLVYLNCCDCQELQHLADNITNLENLMYLNLFGTGVERIPAGLKKLKKLTHLDGFKSDNNCLERFSSLEELENLSHLVVLRLECLEKVTDINAAKGAKLGCKEQLEDLYLAYTEVSCEDQASQANEKKVMIKGVLNELSPPRSIEYLSLYGYSGSCLPNWLSLGTTLANLRNLSIEKCHCFEKLAPLGQLSNLDYLEIIGADSIVTVGQEFLWGKTKGRDSTVAFPKLTVLVFEHMPNWKEWTWNKGEAAMPKLKKLSIISCPKLISLPPGLSHHATSLEYFQINGVNKLTTMENFGSIKEIDVLDNPNMERILNLSSVSYVTIKDCPNLKTVDKLNALQLMELDDSGMEVLPEYLMTVMAKKITIYCREELLRRIVSHGESGSEWHKVKHIPKVMINSLDESLYATCQTTPFSITTNISG